VIPARFPLSFTSAALATLSLSLSLSLLMVDQNDDDPRIPWFLSFFLFFHITSSMNFGKYTSRASKKKKKKTRVSL